MKTQNPKPDCHLAPAAPAKKVRVGKKERLACARSRLQLVTFLRDLTDTRHSGRTRRSTVDTWSYPDLETEIHPAAAARPFHASAQLAFGGEGLQLLSELSPAGRLKTGLLDNKLAPVSGEGGMSHHVS
jgi:hypothetical protein